MSAGRAGLLLIALAPAHAPCPHRCSMAGACAPPACGPACCRYWARTHARRKVKAVASAHAAAEGTVTYRTARSAWNASLCRNSETAAIDSQRFVAGEPPRYPSLAVLTNNSHYRVSDILAHGGKRWRRFVPAESGALTSAATHIHGAAMLERVHAPTCHCARQISHHSPAVTCLRGRQPDACGECAY